MRRAGRRLPMVLSLLLIGAVPAAAQVELRGVAAPVEGKVESVGPEGVVVASPAAPLTGSTSKRLIGWDVVRTIGGQPPRDAELRSTADMVWRARSRLERGDWSAAEPLFEELSVLYRGAAGPTAAIVHEGLLRCRLRRGAQGAAVWAWLDWVSTLRRAGPAERDAWIGGRLELAPIRESITDLVPGLPPVWVGGNGAGAMGQVARAEEWGRFTGSGTDAAVADLARLYRFAAEFEALRRGGAGPAGSELPRTTSEHAGVRLVAEIVAARAGTADERAAARTALQRRIARGGGANVTPPEPWVEAWCRAAIGRSLVMEQTAADRRRGVMELLHLPARFAEEHPYLAGVCLAEAAVTMQDLNEPAAASALIAELRQQFPNHPVLGWERVGEIAGIDGAWDVASRVVAFGDQPVARGP